LISGAQVKVRKHKMQLHTSQVLLVEDDMKLPEVLAELLVDAHIHLSHAPDARAALRLLKDKPFELVLLDLGLPGEMNGFDLLREIKQSPQYETIPVIVLTAWNSTRDKVRGFELGAVDYLTKPFESAELRARVLSALRAKRLQDELSKVNRDLLSARLNAESAARTKADFLANMSHEIRTPMNGVIAMAGLILETPLTQDQRGYVETIHTSSETLLTIINDILDFSKIESGKMEIEQRPYHLRGCIEESLDILAAKAAEKKIEIAYQMEEGLPERVLGDDTRVRQVLTNLLSNAVKFTDQGEVVAQVKVASRPDGPPDGNKPWHLHISVRDTGIGIPPDRLARLFQPFTQADVSTSRHYGGTGLGLAISKRLVELMGGKMWVDSAPDSGSTFHFTLWVQPVPHETPSKMDGAQPQLTGLRLLIVDDNPTNCRILSLQVSKWGMIPRVAATAAQALEWLRAGEHFDLAILDMQMPDMDGLMLASEIRKLPGTMMIPLVLLTSMGVRSDQPEFAQAAFSSCLTKPIKPAQLHETLIRVVSGAKPAKKAATSKLDPEMASRMPLRVLLCDDNVVNQKVAARLLQQMGYRSELAAHGKQALAALDKKPFDLIFMDMMMPEMDGLEATRIIRERQKDRANHPNYKSPIIIVAMTANAMQSDKDKCLAAGMDDYLSKPVRLDDFRVILERWGTSAAMNEHVESQPVNETAPMKPSPPPAVPTADAPVDMERLNELTDGDATSLRELVELYLKQTSGQMEQLKSAVQAADADTVRRVAHSCAGASSTIGVRKMPPLLKEMEREGYEGKLVATPELLKQVLQEFDRVTAFLTSSLAALPQANAPAKS
jgi:CheY-like chemotaxis protein/nitrogen-specific signal transduction histidine kinase